ncbi:hypothetical protein AeMF1_019852 [Aphanomyces euteiches]|nr:hypothetical protein AeMF1_019852 [Aphanomyces euteiches]
MATRSQVKQNQTELPGRKRLQVDTLCIIQFAAFRSAVVQVVVLELHLKLSPGAQIDMKTLELAVRRAVPADVDAIVATAGDAFMADAFFKKPEYHVRFSNQDVQTVMKEPNAAFLVAESTTDHAIYGCIYVEWTVDKVGHFSAVSVPKAFENQGVGRAMIQAAEDFVVACGCEKMEITVVSVRTDLFLFYERKGYQRQIGPIQEYTFFADMLNDDHKHVHFVEMIKFLDPKPHFG